MIDIAEVNEFGACLVYTDMPFCVVAFPSLGSVIPNTSSSAFLPASAPSLQDANLALPFQSTQYASAAIVAVRDGPNMYADSALANGGIDTDAWCKLILLADSTCTME